MTVDRAFSSASAKTDLVSGLSAMFAESVIMPVPPGRFAKGRQAATEALRGNPDNAGSRIDWTPIRGGISADGQHGFTFGYMRWRQRGGDVIPLKYVSYWVKGTAGWRVAAYKRARATEGPPSLDEMPPSLPGRMAAPTVDENVIASHRASLERAEHEFSREAQVIGIGPAFSKYGRSDAVNMGPPDQASFTVGAEAIARSVSSGGDPGTSPVSWGPDMVIVASSGDLGVSIGTIRRNTPPSDPKQPATVPFFTIWRRDSATAPWRYIAE
jgi:ketosteroid isomerase-like protein